MMVNTSLCHQHRISYVPCCSICTSGIPLPEIELPLPVKRCHHDEFMSLSDGNKENTRITVHTTVTSNNLV
jgi:hypothetical protein